VTGRVALLTNERQRNQATSVLAAAPPPKSASPTVDMAQQMQRVANTLLVYPPSARTFVAQRNVIDGDFRFETSLGNIFLAEIRGNANISTRAGEIVLGRVDGNCEATSQGGPINIGEVAGDLQARTSVGDISVRAARSGGVINTEGGSVTVVFAGGPIDIRSGGGDLTLQSATSRVRAQTSNGDIELTMDPKVRSAAINASTVGGSIRLNVAPGFAGDFEITVLTDDANAEKIHVDLQGLTIQKDEFAGRTRIRARGKVNGGGEHVQLFVDGGNVQVRSAARSVVVMKQK
jgi:hypothetical protein